MIYKNIHFKIYVVYFLLFMEKKFDGIVCVKFCNKILNSIKDYDRHDILLLWHFINNISDNGLKSKTLNVLRILLDESYQKIIPIKILQSNLIDLYRNYKLKNCQIFLKTLKDRIGCNFNFISIKILVSKSNDIDLLKSVIDSNNIDEVKIDSKLINGFIVYRNYQKIDNSVANKIHKVLEITNEYSKNYLKFNSIK